MIRVKIIKDHKFYKKGEVVELYKNDAFGLIDSGVAILTKDVTQTETKVKDATTVLRTSKRR